MTQPHYLWKPKKLQSTNKDKAYNGDKGYIISVIIYKHDRLFTNSPFKNLIKTIQLINV